MRVGTDSSAQQQIARFLQAQTRVNEAQERVMTGKTVRRASDAPEAMPEILRTRAHAAELEQRQADVNGALPFMQRTEITLGGMSTLLRQSRTLVLQANNAALNPEQRRALADQLGQLRGRLIELANTREDGRYLFSGTRTDTRPFDPAAPESYAGTNAPVTLELAPDQSLPASITGREILNSQAGTDLFRNLSALEDAIRRGDASAMAGGLDHLDADLNHLVRLRGDMGARLQYVELLRTRLREELDATQARRSQLEDADLAGAILQLKQAEQGHEASLAVTARSGRLSLLDFLR